MPANVIPHQCSQINFVTAGSERCSLQWGGKKDSRLCMVNIILLYCIIDGRSGVDSDCYEETIQRLPLRPHTKDTPKNIPQTR